MKTIKLDKDGSWWEDSTREISFCGDGLSVFFKCDIEELENTIWLNISDKKFDGYDYRVKMEGMEVKVGRKNWYISMDTRHGLKRIIGSDPENQVFYVSYEVKAS